MNNYALGGVLLIAGVGVYLVTDNVPDSNPDSFLTGGYPDIDPSKQGGFFYSKKYDDAFVSASGNTSVPFALLKAHAIRESSLNETAYHFDNETSGASFGLMQLEFKNGKNTWVKYGYSDGDLGSDGAMLYDVGINTYLGAKLIHDNLVSCGNLRDAINMYNTGVRESVRVAPKNYVDDVIKYYSKIVGQKVG